MKGLRIIPFFILLICLSYAGVLFVEGNRDPVVVKFTSQYATTPLALGLVILTAALIGMTVCGLFCSVELLALYFQNQSLRRRLVAKQTETAELHQTDSEEIDREPIAAQNHFL